MYPSSIAKRHGHRPRAKGHTAKNQEITQHEAKSRLTWQTLGSWLQMELLGRPESVRWAVVGGSSGYRNGRGKPQRVSTPLETMLH